MSLIEIALGGFLGAMARYLFYLVAESRWRQPKIATLFVNILGSFVIGAFVGSGNLSVFWLTGFLGAFTTFSTMSLDAVKDFEDGKWLAGISYLAANLVGGLGLFAVAYMIF
ncbi:CrcB family protein [Planomicrobium sp. Y74]|uniref:fluoride efflux transporter FluC n=1 Tax=Planomicrobium sp. Y74 TaxID=2478977 RepID=UPI0025706768|nr:CrcB family protein [Planomicrobium sp. Y74]